MDEVLSIFPKAPALVLTATASKINIEKITQSLSLREPTIIHAHPNRENIKYYKKERSPSSQKMDDLDNILLDVLQGLKKHKGTYPITLMYADLEDISYGYRYLEAALSKTEQYVGGVDVPENRIFAMYHQAYTNTMKSHIVSELGKVNSKVRFVLCTVALGMGLDAPAIRKVIHFKCPTSVEKYLQETGRAGRDSKPSEAILYYNNTDLRANRPGLQSAMVAYCRSDSKCLRQTLMEYLNFSAPRDRVLCKCCEACQQKCMCVDCKQEGYSDSEV